MFHDACCALVAQTWGFTRRPRQKRCCCMGATPAAGSYSMRALQVVVTPPPPVRLSSAASASSRARRSASSSRAPSSTSCGEVWQSVYMYALQAHVGGGIHLRARRSASSLRACSVSPECCNKMHRAQMISDDVGNLTSFSVMHSIQTHLRRRELRFCARQVFPQRPQLALVLAALQWFAAQREGARQKLLFQGTVMRAS